MAFQLILVAAAAICLLPLTQANNIRTNEVGDESGQTLNTSLDLGTKLAKSRRLSFIKGVQRLSGEFESLQQIINTLNLMQEELSQLVLDNQQAFLDELACPLAQGVFPGEALPLSTPVTESCGSTLLLAVGKPITHRYIPQSTAKAGTFLKDPYPLTLTEREKIYVILGQQTSSNSLAQQVLVYDDYASFERGKVSGQIRLYGFRGTGHVVYRGHLYYVDYDHNIRKVKTSDGVHVGNALTIPQLGSSLYYSTGGATLVDMVNLKVDENGLWAVYGHTAGEMLTVARIDPDEMKITSILRTNMLKSSISHCFIICGRLYTTYHNSLINPEMTYYQQVINVLGGGNVGSTPLFIPSKYAKLYQLTYNPREKLIFGYDNGHLVTYTLNLSQ